VIIISEKDMKLWTGNYQIQDRYGRVLYRFEDSTLQTMQEYMDAFTAGYSHVLPLRLLAEDALGELVEISRREDCDETA
jgi:hypothetical protein